ncbi:alpha amylase C-terminal domain-containing protein [Membranihabitans marinus]|uniref:alpha amylase C-terminal domain-containing protein n=1 Tax=Membranihabitans marinus TaxID=1227546 RepID=UPI0028F6E589|nr:alpha amylase C-terminal domain-containing protein [Membranihabitans marinus]
MLHVNPDKNLFFFRRFAEEDPGEILVLLNFSNSEQAFEFELARAGRYHAVLTDEDWDLEEGSYSSTIPGSTARVLKRIGE